MSKQKQSEKLFFTRGTWLYITLALVGAFGIVYYYNAVPAFADAYYHMNGAVSLVTGEGFVDNYLWTFIGAPEQLPAPSHLYWMPGTSVIASLGMFISGANYGAAQVGLALCLWGALLIAYWLGKTYADSTRIAWMAGILTLFSGFFTDMWGQTDTFAPYAFFGAAALVFMALGISTKEHNLRYWLLAGAFAGFGHLIRSDGLILVLVGLSVLLWFFNQDRYRQRLVWIVPFILGYVVIMSPWFARNLNEIGRVLPTGGTQNAWFTRYDDLFNYPPDASPETLLADGGAALLKTRSRALFTTSGIPFQALAYQGTIIFFPLILLGIWNRRRDPFIRPFWIFAIGIHLAFALVFPEAGLRGGFWHATAALVPIWAVIGLLGLDDFVVWAASFRRTWHPKLAQPILSFGFLAIAIVLSVQISSRNTVDDDSVVLALQAVIAPNTRVMLNDPSRLYYYTGISGVTIPNETPEIALEIAHIYDIDYLLLEDNNITLPMLFDTPPEFLIPIPFDVTGARLYAFDRD
ncbi:MAG: glycosyltransferase family 39 protein [Phototrophicaceae bacterium]